MACFRNPNANNWWYWPTGGPYYYYYHGPAPAARLTLIPTPAHGGRALNPSAQPFDPTKVNPKPPSSPSVKLVRPYLPHHLIPSSMVYVNQLPVYQPMLHQPSVRPHAPPLLKQRPPAQRTQEVGSLQGYGGKRATFAQRQPTNKKKAMWRRKVGTCSSSSAAVPVTELAHGSAGDDLAEGTTTLMIRNIPNSLKRKDLMKILDKHCFTENKKLQNQQLEGSCRSEYDFVYLPIDYSTKGNKGYAFVNFTNGDGAKRMCKAYNLFKWDTCYPSTKICNICPAVVQGKDGLRRSLQKRAFPMEEYRPLLAESSPRDGFNDAPFIAVGFGRRYSYRQNVSK